MALTEVSGLILTDDESSIFNKYIGFINILLETERHFAALFDRHAVPLFSLADAQVSNGTAHSQVSELLVLVRPFLPAPPSDRAAAHLVCPPNPLFFLLCLSSRLLAATLVLSQPTSLTCASQARSWLPLKSLGLPVGWSGCVPSSTPYRHALARHALAWHALARYALAWYAFARYLSALDMRPLDLCACSTCARSTCALA